jgi:hypothetical protein
MASIKTRVASIKTVLAPTIFIGRLKIGPGRASYLQLKTQCHDSAVRARGRSGRFTTAGSEIGGPCRLGASLRSETLHPGARDLLARFQVRQRRADRFDQGAARGIAGHRFSEVEGPTSERVGRCAGGRRSPARARSCASSSVSPATIRASPSENACRSTPSSRLSSRGWPGSTPRARRPGRHATCS